MPPRRSKNASWFLYIIAVHTMTATQTAQISANISSAQELYIIFHYSDMNDMRIFIFYKWDYIPDTASATSILTEKITQHWRRAPHDIEYTRRLDLDSVKKKTLFTSYEFAFRNHIIIGVWYTPEVVSKLWL